MPAYTPDEVLTAIAKAISQLKAQYLPVSASASDKTGRCILVGHDWGGVIAGRLAAETSELIDHAVLVNTIHVSV